MTSSTEPRGPFLAGRLLLALCGSLLGLGCGSETSVENPIAPGLNLGTGLALSDTAANPGDTIAVMVLGSRPDSGPLALVQGILRFDPSALTYLGQPLAGNAIVLVGDTGADHGTLRSISVRMAGLDGPVADLRFEVRRADYAKSISWRLELAGSPEVELATRADRLPLRILPPLPGPPPRKLTAMDWARYFGIDTTELRFKPLSAGDGTVYGDLTLNGVINGLDVLAVSNMAVGNRQLLTDPTKDYVIAGNVFPANLPGLGEPSDPVPPGQETDGSFIINGGDVLTVANEAVGNDRPIAGEAIPGRTPRPFHAVVFGDIIADRTFFRDTVYELQGSVSVLGGVHLTVEPGTRIEGDAATRGALVIRRGARIFASGTRLEPIVFTCNAGSKTPGCWGGLVMDGFSLLNNDQTGNPIFGCPQKPSIGNSDVYGGCLVQDTSGTLRYVRVEYGGMPVTPGATPTPSLALLGNGTGTLIENVQVHGSAGDGLFVSGGTVSLRYVASTASGLAGLSWEDGWVGKGQFIYVQQGMGSGDGVRGLNWSLNTDARPRSAPQLYNLTLTSGGTGAMGQRGLVFDFGSGGTIRNSIVFGSGMAGLDIDGQSSCNQVSGTSPTLLVENTIFFGNTPDFDTDPDCIDETAYATALARANRTLDPGLIAIANTLTPDLRPATGSAATTGFVLPPPNTFFDPTATYLGAVAPANAGGTNVPWYAGWTRGWAGMP